MFFNFHEYYVDSGLRKGNLDPPFMPGSRETYNRAPKPGGMYKHPPGTIKAPFSGELDNIQLPRPLKALVGSNFLKATYHRIIVMRIKTSTTRITTTTQTSDGGSVSEGWDE